MSGNPKIEILRILKEFSKNYLADYAYVCFLLGCETNSLLEL